MKSILLVDRNPEFLDLEAAFLRRSSFKVDVARTGREALDLLGRKHIDLTIVDSHLEDMSGADLVGATLAELGKSAPKQLVLTDDARPEVIDACLRAGCDGYMLKPLDSDAFLANVAGLLAVQVRSAPRILLRVDVRAAARAALGDTPIVASSIDISESGMLLDCPVRFEVGTVVALHFFLPGDTAQLLVEAEVVREQGRAPQHKHGVRFLAMSEPAQQRLRAFIDRSA